MFHLKSVFFVKRKNPEGSRLKLAFLQPGDFVFVSVFDFNDISAMTIYDQHCHKPAGGNDRQMLPLHISYEQT